MSERQNVSGNSPYIVDEAAGTGRDETQGGR